MEGIPAQNKYGRGLSARPNGLSQTKDSGFPGHSSLWLVSLLGATLAMLFYQSFLSHRVLFANDSPLGFLTAESNRMLHRFNGSWRTLNWLGGETPSPSVTVSSLLVTIVPPELFLKIFAPLSLFLVGFSAWVFFRSLQFSPMVCVLGGVATGLNMHFFSIACWGLGQWNIGAAMMFLAMAALCSKSIKQTWAKAILAGLAVGMGVLEAYDVGAILSVYVGVFVVFRALSEEAPVARKILTAVGSEALVIFFALFIGAHTISSLVETQIEGVSAMNQDVETKETRWDSATQWSLPKWETLEIVAPGLFGYRLSGNIPGTNHSSAYWGLIGQSPRIPELGSDDAKVRASAVSRLKLPESYLPALDTPNRVSRTTGMNAVTQKTGIYWRFFGTGESAGIMVFLLALFAIANLWRKVLPWSSPERRAVAFWGLIALVSLLAAWGRFGFLYRLLYQLPYFSTIRNPVKFLHPFHIALLILAAYGMEFLYRRYLRVPAAGNELLPHHLQVWWAKVTGFDRYWTLLLMGLAGLSIVGFALLYANKPALIHYLENQNFNPRDAATIAKFSVASAGWFLIFLAASIVVISGIVSGAWSGTRAKWAWTFLGVLIVLNLACADYPWIRYYDYTEKYAFDPVVNFLSDKPYEHRVIGKLEPRGPGSGIPKSNLGQLYFFWLQNDFPYHDIQTLDFSQWPHIPDRDRLYLENFQLGGGNINTVDLRPAVRLWQLTNTRYLLSNANTAEQLNTRADPIHHTFKLDGLFNLRPKSGVAAVEEISDLTAVPGDKGIFGIIEYPRTLPRAKLYSNWQTPDDEAIVLKTLATPEFEPLDTVLISKETSATQANSASTADAGAVQIEQYHPKYVKMEADAKTPCILLFNDRWNPNWAVRVDGVKSALLRCNYIMRGVYLTPGHHVVEFRFEPSATTLYISLAAIGIGILLSGYLIIVRQPAAVTVATPPVPTPPAPPPSASEPAPPQRAAPSKQSKLNGKPKGPK